MKYDPRAGRVKRDAALARPELRQAPTFNKVDDRLPDIDRVCTVWAHEPGKLNMEATYRLPFPVVLKSDGRWYNARHDRPLVVQIVGWLYRP